MDLKSSSYENDDPESNLARMRGFSEDRNDRICNSVSNKNIIGSSSSRSSRNEYRGFFDEDRNDRICKRSAGDDDSRSNRKEYRGFFDEDRNDRICNSVSNKNIIGSSSSRSSRNEYRGFFDEDRNDRICKRSAGDDDSRSNRKEYRGFFDEDRNDRICNSVSNKNIIGSSSSRSSRNEYRGFFDEDRNDRIYKRSAGDDDSRSNRKEYRGFIDEDINYRICELNKISSSDRKQIERSADDDNTRSTIAGPNRSISTSNSYILQTNIIASIIDFGKKCKIQEDAARDDVQNESNEDNNFLLQNKDDTARSQALIIAVKERRLDIVASILLKHCVSVDFIDNEKRSAIDHAWMNYTDPDHNNNKAIDDKIIMKLLKQNSKFPKGFDVDQASKTVQEFLKMCEDMHSYVFCQDDSRFNETLRKNPGLTHFYDRNNESVLSFAMKRGDYKVINRNIDEFSIGPDDSDTIFKALVERHSEDEISKFHLVLLISRSKIVTEDGNRQKRLKCINDAYKILDGYEDCSKVLKIAAACSNLNIYFDFKKDATHNLFLKDSKFSQDSIYSNGAIYITAKQLLEDNTKYEAIGTLIHELGHFAVLMTFMNNFNPYPMGESEEKVEFINKVVQEYEMKMDLVGSSFKSNPEEHLHSELIVKPMQIVMSNYKNHERASKIKCCFPALFKYHEDVVVKEFERALPVLQKLNDKNKDIEASDLTKPMRAKILHTPVNFQSKISSIFEIIDDNLELLSLSPKDIRSILLESQQLTIGNIIEKNTIIPRKYIRLPIDDVNTTSEDPKSFEEVAFEVKELKVLVLTDKAGSGKTAAFEDLAVNLKEKYSSFWVAMIKLRDHQEAINEIEKSSDYKIEEILMKLIDIKPDIDTIIFNHLYKNGKVILLLDGFDEIYPESRKTIITLLDIISTITDNQLWVSTRPHVVEELKTIPKATFYKFDSCRSEEFMEKKHSEHYSDNVKRFLKIVEQMRNGKDHNIDNPSIMDSILELSIANEIYFTPDSTFLYTIVNDLAEKIMHKNCVKAPIEAPNQLLTQKLLNSYHYHGLKIIFGAISEEQLGFKFKDLAIIKKCENSEKVSIINNKIQHYGLMSVDNNSLDFIHRIFAEFYVAQYLATFIFDADCDIKDEEFEKVFLLLRFISNSPDCKIVQKLLLSYVKTKAVENDEFLEDQILSIFERNILLIEKDPLKDNTLLSELFTRKK